MNNNILQNINIILAKLKPSQYREYWKIWNANFRDRYKEIFGNKYRIYLDYPNDENEIEVTDEIEENIKMVNLVFKSFNITRDYEVKNIKDYLEGYASKKHSPEKPIKENHKTKIGKLLNKVINYVEKGNIEDNERNLSLNVIKKTMEIFNKRPSLKEINKPKLVCISRHPYDIAGMSTDRRWTSCMRLEDKEKYIDAGGMKGYIKNDIEEGTLIAYLIYEDDKNINRPLARVLIKPYINSDDPTDIILIPEPIVYSDKSLDSYKTFIDIVEKWLEGFQGEKTGTYVFNKNLYRDRSPGRIVKVNKNALEKIKDNITIANHSYDKNLKDIVAKHPWLLDGEFENLVIYTREGGNILIIDSGTWKNGVITYAEIGENVVIEYGIIYKCSCLGTMEDGIFYQGGFYGTFKNGIWLSGSFNIKAEWENGKWCSGTVMLRDESTNELFNKNVVLNPNIVKKINEESKDEDDFIYNYNKYKLKVFGSEENVKKHLNNCEDMKERINKIVSKYDKDIY